VGEGPTGAADVWIALGRGAAAAPAPAAR